MALISSASLRACARPTAAPRAAVVAPRPVVCRAKAEDALKMATDLLGKGLDAAKSMDTAQASALVAAAKQPSCLAIFVERPNVQPTLVHAMALGRGHGNGKSCHPIT